MRKVITLAAAALGLAVLASAGPAGEEKVPLDKLPKAVAEAVKARFPEAKLVGAEQEKENGKALYEVALKDKGQHVEATFTPEGKLVEIERQIAVKDLPRAVADAVRAKHAGATFKKAEEVTKVKDGKEKLAYYEVRLTTAEGGALEVEVAPDGRILRTEGGKPREKKDKD